MLKIGFKTHKGRVRTHNEDACFILPEKNIYIVADGVGGNSGGEIASRTAVYEITQFVNENELPDDPSPSMIKGYFDIALDRANKAVLRKASERSEAEGMATTVVICCIRGMNAYFAHVGDSRGYVIRNGKIFQITKDHTYVNNLLDAGVITEDEALVHDKRHVITKALGADESIEADYVQAEVRSGDTILLCTDGLYDELEGHIIAGVAGDQKISMSDACERLVELANVAGGRDNITVVCLRI